MNKYKYEIVLSLSVPDKNNGKIIKSFVDIIKERFIESNRVRFSSTFYVNDVWNDSKYHWLYEGSDGKYYWQTPIPTFMFGYNDITDAADTIEESFKKLKKVIMPEYKFWKKYNLPANIKNVKGEDGKDYWIKEK